MQPNRPSTEECGQSFCLKVRNAGVRHPANQRADASAIYDQKAEASGNARLRESEREYYELGSPGTGKSHLAQAIGQASIQQGYRVLYREAHALINELADASLDHTRKEQLELFATVPLLIIDDLGMRTLPAIAAEDLLEIVMRRYERASTILTSNRPIEDWGKLLGDTAAVTAMLDRFLITATFSSAAREAGAPKRNYLMTRKPTNKEGGLFLDRIYRFVPIPKLENKTGRLTTPRFGLGP